MDERSSVIKDVIWSTSVQHGAKGGALVIQRALAGQDIENLSDTELINRIYRSVCLENILINIIVFTGNEVPTTDRNTSVEVVKK